jgi:hypothetical protein
MRHKITRTGGNPAADNAPLEASHLEASHFGFGLGSSQFVERACRLFGRSELGTEVSTHLRHAQHGFGGDVAIV